MSIIKAREYGRKSLSKRRKLRQRSPLLRMLTLLDISIVLEYCWRFARFRWLTTKVGVVLVVHSVAWRLFVTYLAGYQPEFIFSLKH